MGLFVGVVALCLGLSPAEVNGDGIGYLKAARDGALYPGHLAYLPLLRAVWWAGRKLGLGTAIVDGIWPGRVLSAVGAALACVLCARIVSSTRGTRAGLLAGAGLGASAAVLGAGCDLESYGPALAALLAVVWLRDRAVLAALALSLATLLHVENALFGLCTLTLVSRPLWPRFVLVSVGATVAAYLVAGLSLSSLPHASHGFSYPLHLYTPFVALWGALRSIVFVPYLYEATVAKVAACTVVAFAFVVAITWRATWPLSRVAVVAWLVPYSLVGVLFFASDPERWIFVLPLLWMAARPRMVLVALLVIVNVTLWLPHARDDRGVAAARAAATHFAPGDLVLMPGHGWDESLALAREDVRTFPLVFFAAARGGSIGLGAALDEALLLHDRVVSVRLDGDELSGPLGWKELARSGLDRAGVDALLRAHGLIRGAALGDGVTLWTRRISGL